MILELKFEQKFKLNPRIWVRAQRKSITRRTGHVMACRGLDLSTEYISTYIIHVVKGGRYDIVNLRVGVPKAHTILHVIGFVSVPKRG